MGVLTLEHLMGMRGVFLLLWFVLFIISIFLFISGIKVENKTAKLLLVILSLVLAILSVYLFLYTLLFGYNS